MATKQQHEVLIREAQPQDLPQIQQLGSHVFTTTFGHSVPPSQLQSYLNEFYSLESIEQDFTDPQKDLIVATDPSGITILGFALLTQGTSEPCVDHIDDKIELQRIYVGNEYHGMGIGRLLSDRVDDLARRKGFRVMWLGVWEENYRAQKVYEKFGYTVVGDHDFAIGEVVQTDWIMMKEL